MRVLVTGASGFVGRELLAALLPLPGVQVRAAVRAAATPVPAPAQKQVVGELGTSAAWAQALSGCDAVVHLAARVHVMRAHGAASDAEFARINAAATMQLATQALAAGVRQFVFLSSVKVNGERTGRGEAFRGQDPPAPLDAYARSKLKAEQGLHELARHSGLEVSVVRAPLVYGPGVRANFLRLLRWVERERLLPFGAVRNRRSLVSVWNLCSLLVRLLQQPRAGTAGAWMVSDGEDLSTPELVRRLAGAMQRRARLFSVPERLLRLGGALSGHTAEVARLCDSLVLDCADTRARLNWSAPLSVDEGLRRTAQWYLGQADAA